MQSPDHAINPRIRHPFSTGWPWDGVIEWPTLGLIVGTYIAIAAIVLHFDTAPLAFAIGLSVLLAFHTSLVHEIIHGHPTPWRGFNDLLGALPLALIYPYSVFRNSHLAHHNDETLTLPGIDPESFYCSRTQWLRKSGIAKAIAWINMTLAGRLLLNPLVSVIRVIRLAAHQLGTGNAGQRVTWIAHFLGCTLLLFVIARMTPTPLWVYIGCVYLSHSLISLRSFFEHRASKLALHRIVVVEGSRFFSFLYLNNNFHATHHRYPTLPWYQVQRQFRREGGMVLERNGNFHYRGYQEWLRFLFRPVASPVHPFAE